ncbi:hypothetical protein LF1_01310 [Rubripirellula obstinata]|uniref:Uncharacterized protein n=2 Tax=Rubripirellula obstinata TaxID=406547 RepID=A0A5B1CDV4_9BACT|nr:hypothetical protein [Rubripirellula obstinata]KAA1257643.1 hypothetical protein LF1_01310 [Rubripirellula obstinata]
MDTESNELSPATASVLRRFAARRTRLIWVRALAVGLLALALTMAVVMLVDYRWVLPTGTRLLISLIGYLVTVAAMWWTSLRFLKLNDQYELARQLESVDPRLREDLLSAVELSGGDGANGSFEFRERLQRVVALRAAGMDVAKLLPMDLLKSWLTAAAIVGGLTAVLLLIPPLQIGRRIARAMLPGLAIERASFTEVKIIEPDPASGFVAHGDAVGIIAEVSNLTRLGWGQWISEDGVWLQYQSGDAKSSKIEMTPRAVDASVDQAIGDGNEFAANLMMGQSPVRYRIIAGDAVTLWNTLTPQSRPRVAAFSVEYDYPVYSKLPVETVLQDHGDLRAVVGTRATVTVEFDEPVSDALFRMGNRRREINLTSIDGSTTRYKALLPIESPGEYQVDAVSRRSGLSNPFGRRYSIVPLVDSPPIVRWDESMPASRVVSPIEVVSLAAEVVDDIPIERVLQKTIVNGEALDAVPVDLGQASRKHAMSWQWDLFALGRTLSVGDIVQTRLVAIDRRGQMSDSEMIEFLVAEKGFDSQRHDSLDRLHRLANLIHRWFKQAKPATESFDGDDQNWDELQLLTDSLIATIQTELALASDQDIGNKLDLSEPLEQVGNAIVDWNARMTMLRIAGNNGNGQQAEIERLSRQLDLIDEDVRALFSHAMTVGLISDAIAMRRTMTPLLNPESGIPAARYGRYLNVVSGRLVAMESMIQTYSSGLQESTLEHIEKWRKWSDRWTTELDDLAGKEIATGDEARMMLDRLNLFDLELRQQTRHSILDGRLASTMSQTTRELDRTTQSVGEATAKVAERLSEEVVAALLEKVSSEVSLHRQLPDVDLRYAADLNLFKRATEAVSVDGFDQQVHREIASAIEVLSAAHRVEAGRRLVARLASAEQRLSDTALARVDHPAQLERFSTRMEHSIGLLKSAGIDWSLLKPIDETRFAADYAQARDRITRRRWSDDAMQSAAGSLGEIREQLKRSLVALSPVIDEARRVLLKYAPTIAELANAAEAEVKQDDTTEKTDDVVEALHDFANTADLIDPGQRELSRDADSAAAQIQVAKRNAELSEPSDSDDAMQQLADILRATAEHFDNADKGKDLAESREELRRREQEMNLQDDLNQLSKRTEAIADAAAKTPEEFLKQLEQQLRQNEDMQNELNEIADRAQQAIEDDLERLASDENEINRSLEASDPEILERKRRMSREMVAANRKLTTIKEALVAGAERSSNWGNLGETGDDLQQAQSELADAMEILGSAEGEKDTLDSIRQTATRAAEAIAGIAERMNDVAGEAGKQIDENLHQNEAARAQQQQSLQRFERDARRKQISGERIVESLWKGVQNAAKQRERMNHRLQSVLQQQAKQLRKDAEKLDADSETLSQREQRQQQLDTLQAKANEVERKTKAAEETKDFARTRIEQAADQRRKLERERLEPLDKPNPAAQLAQRMANAAKDELRKLESLLGDVADEMDASDDLMADPDQAKELVQRQADISEDIQSAADHLRRIARHQKRLGETQRAEKLSDVAEEIELGAKVASENAESDLRDASKSPEQSPQANRQIVETAKEINDVNAKLAAPENSDAGEGDGDSGASASRSDRQLAQTLDELDRSIAKPDATPESAGEASPTLSSALESVAQQVARRRQQSTESSTDERPLPENSTDEPAGEPAEGEVEGKDGGEGMPGDPPVNPPGGPSVPIDGIELGGSEWGQLRSRRDENAGQANRALVPNQYRREIEAYFRAIASGQGESR